jgi:CRISPR-associated protein Cas2
MTVIIMENVSPSLRGKISKWLLEVKAGVFLGNLNRLVRDLVWQDCVENSKGGSVMMIWKSNTEQGFDIKHHNLKNYIPVDFEGIWLVKKV